jgi:predicted helicase
MTITQYLDKINTRFKIDELFLKNAEGIKIQRDDASVAFTKKEVEILASDFINLSEEELKNKYGYVDVRNWKISYAKDDLQKNLIIANKLLYRPFDFRYMNYTGKAKDVMGHRRFNVMQYFLNGDNVGIILATQAQTANVNFFDCIFITNHIAGTNMYKRSAQSIFPLYFYPENNNQLNINQRFRRTPNLNPEIVKQIASQLSLTFTNEKEIPTEGEVCFINSPEVRPEFRITFSPIDILDYIYAVLHSPSYREKYKEFLKIDFPRVPYPTDNATFWKLVALGGELRQIHLLECSVVENYVTQYPVDGNNLVGKIRYTDNKVFINETQYFDHVPQIAWEFYIGGYQPAQKWLKDRKGRELDFEDILHYQKIIVALMETDRIMKEIDKIKID